MGICFFAEDRSGPMPWPLMLELQCDLDGTHCAVFSQGNYVDAMSAAMRLGWKESREDGSRIFLCPQCSGKRPASTDVD